MGWWDDPNQLNRIEQNIHYIVSQLNKLTQGEKNMSAELDALKAQVAQNASVEASAVALIHGLAAQLAAAIAKNDPVALQAFTTDLQASANALAAAITASTPLTNTANTP
jgi:hypothetical protein